MGVASPVAEGIKTWNLKKCGNINKLSELDRMIA